LKFAYSDIVIYEEEVRKIKDKDKTKEQLITELKEMRRRITELEAREIEHTQIEEELRESEKQCNHLFEQSPVGIGVSSLDGRVFRSNKAIQTISGYSNEEFNNLNLTNIYAGPEDRKLLLEKVNQNGSVINYPVRLKRKDGTLYDAMLNVARIHLKGEDVLQTILIDITERKQAEQEISKFKTMSDQAPWGTGIADLEGKFLYVNESYARMLGYAPDELIGQYTSILYPEEARETLHRRRRQRLKDGTYSIEERWHKRKDGSILPTHTTIIPVKDEKGRILFIASVVIDITEHKQAEEALRESEEKFSKAFHCNPGASIITNMKDGKYIDVNEGFSLITGYTREEVIGHNPVGLGIWSEEQHRELIKRIIENGKVSNLLSEFHTKTRKPRLALFSAESFNIGNEQYLITLANDITEGKRAAEALQESEKKYRELANSLPQIIYELDEKGYFTFANRNAFQATGYTHEDLDTGLHALQVFVPEDRERVRRNIHRVLSGEKLEGNEYRALRKDGSTFPVVIYTNPIVKGNTVVGLRGIVIDITEGKRAERKPKKKGKSLT